MINYTIDNITDYRKYYRIDCRIVSRLHLEGWARTRGWVRDKTITRLKSLMSNSSSESM